MSLKNIPGPFTLPIIGNLYQYKFGKFDVLKYHKVLEHLYEKYGPIVREKIGNETVIHLFDPNDGQKVLNKQGRRPKVVPLQETAQLYRKKSDMSLGLGNSNGEEWYKLRQGVKPFLFNHELLSKLSTKQASILNDTVGLLNKKINSNGQVDDLKNLFGKWTLESSGMTCFDRRLGYLTEEDVEKLGDKVIAANAEVFYLSGLLKFSFPFYKYLPTPKWRKLHRSEDVITDATKQHLEETFRLFDKVKEENGGTLPEDRFTVMQSMLNASDLTRKDITTIILSIHTDGLSTTVPALLYNLYCLAIHPEIQEQAYKQLVSLVEKGEESPIETWSQNATWVNAVIKETFRFFPVGTEVSRVLETDLVLSGYNVPQGTNVNLNMNVNFFSEKYFKDAAAYKPERWFLTKGELEERHKSRHVLMPFGMGVRTCAGRLLADRDLAMMISRILLSFKLEYPKDEKPLEQVFHTLLFPDRNPPIKFISRS